MKDEFARQLNNLIQKGYPELAGVTDDDFINLLNHLKDKLSRMDLYDIDPDNGKLPFVIVIKGSWITPDAMMEKVLRENQNGVVKLYPRKPEDFTPIGSVTLPEGQAYLLLNIDRGKKSINIAPNEALVQIQKDQRSPLTVDEGIAIVTHYPEFLMKNNCFSLSGSRCQGDKRVPAIWIDTKKQPNLGWCWEGNPHTWLGSASCSGRVG